MSFTIVNIGDKKLRLKVDLFENEESIDIDKILQIDYKNLLAEIITFPVILNKLGILLSKMDNKIAEADLDLTIFKSKINKEIRNNYLKKKEKKVTNDMVDDERRMNPEYLKKNQRYNTLKKNRDIVNSIYWSAKDKSEKLTKLSLTFQPGELSFQDLTKTFNNIQIKNIKNNSKLIQ